MPLSAARVLLHPPKRYCLYYNGVNAYVDCGSDSSLFPTNSITVLALVKVNDSGTNRMILHHAYSYDSKLGIEFSRRSTNRFGILIGDGTSLYSAFTSTLVTDESGWVMAGFSWDGSEIRMYLNGEPDGSPTSFSGPISYDPAGTCVIGGRYARWYGDMAIFLIYNRGLSDSEHQYIYLNPMSPILDGLVLWLKMEEGSGTTVHDYSGYGNDGTIYGATWKEITHDPVRTLSPVRILSNVR